MRVQSTRTISLTIIAGAISVGLTIALLVGWTLVVIRNTHLAEQVAGNGSSNVWLLVAGILSLVTIMFVLTLLSVYLVREVQRGTRQTRFVDSVTHELKSPLASLKLCLQTLERPNLTEAHRVQLGEMMTRDVDRLSAFIDDVLTASRLTHGELNLIWSEVDLAPLLQRLAEQAMKRREAPLDGLHLDLEGDLRVYADPTVLEMIFKNLIDNAVKYSDPPVKLEITGRPGPKSTVMVEVKDHGIGVPKDQLKHIFKRFYRVDQAEVRARHGTGLGLYVVRALVQSLRGKLGAASDGAGLGTTMTVRLPVGQRHRQEIPADPIAASDQ